MVSLKIIEKIIDNAIETKGLMIVKCKPSYRPSVLRAFQKYADQYGFTLKSYKDKDIYNKDAMVTIYDPVHNTGIEFSKDFINKNLIDFQNTDKKKINIEDIFTSYDQLPDKCKDSTGLIKHTIEELRKASAWTNQFSREDDEFNVITIPSYYVEDLTGRFSEDTIPYEQVLAHESMHSRDLYEFTKEEKEAYVKYWGSNKQPLTSEEYELKQQVDNIMDNKYENFTVSYGSVRTVFDKETGETYNIDNYSIFREGDNKNLKYLNKDGSTDYNSLNYASDYGRTNAEEQYAECGAMVITGYHNPTNPNAKMKVHGEWIQYQEWARMHPYQIQSIVKDLYGEEPSIDDILADTVSTRYGEFGVKIEDKPKPEVSDEDLEELYDWY